MFPKLNPSHNHRTHHSSLLSFSEISKCGLFQTRPQIVTQQRVSSSSSSRSSKSSSTSSSLSVPFPSNSNLHPNPKTMEEVWKDINLASLHDHPSSDQYFSVSTPTSHHRRHRHNNPNLNNHNNFILQDFLARPFSNKDPPTRNVNNVPTSTTTSTITTTATATATSNSSFYSSPSIVIPPPPTVLSLNSASRLDFLDASDPLRPGSHLETNPISNLSSFTNPMEVLASSSGFPMFCKKRVQESSDISSSDRRHKRMIKNRESAARSRARKQAYTSELELEVAQLTEENARLKRQQEELCLAAAAQLPKKYTLHRTSTAPF